MRVALTAQAERSLEEIGDWIAADDPDRAVSFVAELRAAANALVKFPEAFPSWSAFGIEASGSACMGAT